MIEEIRESCAVCKALLDKCECTSREINKAWREWEIAAAKEYFDLKDKHQGIVYELESAEHDMETVISILGPVVRDKERNWIAADRIVKVGVEKQWQYSHMLLVYRLLYPQYKEWGCDAIVKAALIRLARKENDAVR